MKLSMNRTLQLSHSEGDLNSFSVIVRQKDSVSSCKTVHILRPFARLTNKNPPSKVLHIKNKQRSGMQSIEQEPKVSNSIFPSRIKKRIAKPVHTVNTFYEEIVVVFGMLF